MLRDGYPPGKKALFAPNVNPNDMEANPMEGLRGST